MLVNSPRIGRACINKPSFLKGEVLLPSLSCLHGTSRQKRIRVRSGNGPTSSDNFTIQTTEWTSKTIQLPAHPRGCHVVTRVLLAKLPEIYDYEVGLAHFFIQHTSASLTINENASPDVPLDLADSLDRLVPEDARYRHIDEGADDMPAHVKASLMGPGLTIPIVAGRLALGIWQGIYLNEHRDYGGPRSLVVTLQGQRRADGRRYGKYV